MTALARLGSRLSWALFKRETVGFDSVGNKYWRQLDKNPEGEVIERRMVKYADDTFDPQTLPPEWLQWLQKTRPDAPDPSAIAEGEVKRAAAAARAAAADAAAETARRRWQAEQAGGDAPGAAFMPQLGTRTVPDAPAGRGEAG